MSGVARAHERPRPTRAWSAGVFLALCCLVCLADQILKLAARSGLTPGQSVTLVPGVLALDLVSNEGAAFGILGGHVAAFVACAAVVVCLCAACVLVGGGRTRLEVVSLAMVCAGALGNLIDRVSLGHVVDYIRVLFVDFPVFNLADISITCGFVLFLVAGYLSTRRDGEARHAGEGVPDD